MPKFKTIPIIPIHYNDSTGNTPSVGAAITKQILENKRPVNGEIELTLFEHCNIVCDFCHHDKDSTVGMTLVDMMAKIPTIENFLQQKQNQVDFMQINVVGGELFQDEQMEELCAKYWVLMSRLKPLFDKYNHVMKVVWVSNFLFKKVDVVKTLLDNMRGINIDTQLIASYDFDGRPMSNRYRKNIKFYGPEYISSINCVGTVSSIATFMEDGDDYFKWLYATFPIYFDDYIPDKGYSDEIPSDLLIYEWYKFVADNYPQISPIRELIENDNNPMHCLSLNKLTIFPDGSVSNCRWNRYDQSDFKTEYQPADNAGMMQTFLDEHNCLSCEYYNRCGFRCFTQHDWIDRTRNMSTCTMKAFYNYITKHEDYTEGTTN